MADEIKGGLGHGGPNEGAGHGDPGGYSINGNGNASEDAPMQEAFRIASEMRALEKSILLDRLRFMKQAGITFDGKRDEYEIFGYDRIITTKQYRDEYDRGGIAGRVVDVMPDACWRGEPAFELIEDEDPEVSTEFEEAWAELDLKHKICAKLQRTDRLSRLSTYAVILIGAPGEPDLELTRGTPDSLLYLRPFIGSGGPGTNDAKGTVGGIETYATIDAYDEDPKSPRFGEPRTYRIRGIGVDSTTMTKAIHWSRVIHVAEGLLEDEVFGRPALERVWNLLIDLRKVTGGGSEAFWLRANQGMHLDIDKDMSLSPTAYADVMAKLHEQSELYKHQMTRWLKTRGVKAQPLSSDVANFANPADAVLTQIAGAKAIPKRILTGSEMGELASSQDRENFKDQINGRQYQHCGPNIVRPLADRLIAYGYLPTPSGGPLAYQVQWPHIQVLTEQEKSSGALQWSQTKVGEDPVFTDAEIRDKWYGMPPLTDEQLGEIDERKEEAVRRQQEAMAATRPTREDEDEDELRAAGGPGSGNFGHAGRPGEVGGSGSGGGEKAAREKRIIADSLKRELTRGQDYGLEVEDVQKVQGGYRFDIRHWGDWEVPPDEEDDGDYDWKVPTKRTRERLDKIVGDVQRKNPGYKVRWENSGEKNWLSFFVLDPGSSGHFLSVRRVARAHNDELVEVLAEAICAGNKEVVLSIIGMEPRLAGFNPDQARDERGRWTDGGGDTGAEREVSTEMRDRPSSSYTKARPEGIDTKEQYRLPNGDYTPERLKLHDEIIDSHLAGRTPVANPTAVIMGGGPASGKSTLERAQGISEGNKVLINPDNIKAMLPEYKEGIAAGNPNTSLFAHEESSDVSTKLQRVAAEKGYNIVLDGTGDSQVEKLGGKIAVMRNAGHRIVAKYVTLPTDRAVQLAHERYLKTGRKVPEEYQRDAHAAVSRTFPAAIAQGLFDVADLYDTSELGNMVHVVSARGKKLTVHNKKLWDTFLAKGSER